MSVWLSFHLWRGFGASGGLFPEVRLGVVTFGFCRGAIGDLARTARTRLEALYAGLINGVPK